MSLTRQLLSPISMVMIRTSQVELFWNLANSLEDVWVMKPFVASDFANVSSVGLFQLEETCGDLGEYCQ